MSQPSRHIIMFGPQGSGKGTQARQIARRFGLVYVGTGELLRDQAEEATPTGRRVAGLLATGELFPDDVMHQMIASRLGSIQPATGFVLDGYPRNQRQVDDLHGTLAGLGRLVPEPVVIHLRVPSEELVRRLEARRQTEGRSDDTEQGIVRRLDIFEQYAQPVLTHLDQWTKLIEINGFQEVGTVTEEIIERLSDGQT